MKFKINNTEIGPEYPTYIIAELSCNHNGNFEKAVELVHKAKEAGANAIKLQTYLPETITLNCDNKYFQIDCGTIWDGKTLYELYTETYTPWDWCKKLKEVANGLGLDCFSSPFDVTAVDFLEEIGVPCYKIASFEVCDHILLKRVAQTGKPVIISSGVSDLQELSEAVNVLHDNGCTDICILKCTSAYPAPIEKANLKTIQNIAETFNVVAGLSDHTTGIEVPITAVCLGARIVEKHFKLEENSGSQDDAFSLTPHEFKQMVDSIRKAELAIGNISYNKSGQEKKNHKFKRSLFIVKNVKKGEILNKDNLKSIRPNYGLHTRYYNQLLGCKVTRDISLGTPISWDLVGEKCAKLEIQPVKKNDSDCQIIFEWRNDSLTRKMSHNTNLKEWNKFREEFHLNYFRKDISYPLFGILNGKKVGFVSFIRYEDNIFTIGINMNPKYRGMGLGTVLIEQSIKYMKQLYKIEKVIAEIKDANKASIKIFAKNNFNLSHMYKKNGEEIRIYELIT